MKYKLCISVLFVLISIVPEIRSKLIFISTDDFKSKFQVQESRVYRETGLYTVTITFIYQLFTICFSILAMPSYDSLIIVTNFIQLVSLPVD